MWDPRHARSCGAGPFLALNCEPFTAASSAKTPSTFPTPSSTTTAARTQPSPPSPKKSASATPPARMPCKLCTNTSRTKRPRSREIEPFRPRASHPRRNRRHSLPSRLHSPRHGGRRATPAQSAPIASKVERSERSRRERPRWLIWKKCDRRPSAAAVASVWNRDSHQGAINESIDLAASVDWASAASGEGPAGEPGPPGTLGRE